MSINRICLKISGSNGQDVTLSAFLEEVGNVRETLNSLNRKIAGSGKPTLEYRITKFKKENPLLIEIEATPMPKKKDYVEEVVTSFFNGLEYLNKGAFPEGFDKENIAAFKKLGSKCGKGIGKIVIENGNRSISIEESVGSKIKSILGDIQIDKGFVSGILEALNVHGNNKKFTIYPVVGSKIDCYFIEELVEQAIKSVKRYIKLTGNIKYRKDNEMPFEIKVDSIEVFPLDDELPKFSDIRGIAPNATHGLMSEDFVRVLRDREKD